MLKNEDFTGNVIFTNALNVFFGGNTELLNRTYCKVIYFCKAKKNPQTIEFYSFS